MPSRRIAGDVGLALVGLLVLIWSLLPLYHMFSISITGDGAIFSGRYWPEHPTVENYRKVFAQDHFFLRNFWRQMANSVIAALVSVALVLSIGTMAAFVVSRQEKAERHGKSHLRLSRQQKERVKVLVPTEQQRVRPYGDQHRSHQGQENPAENLRD